MCTNLAHLPSWDPESGALNVIIETAKGNRNKLKFDGERCLFKLSKVLPRGMAFPFDFGFIPSTTADDGDPLDVLVLMDEPTVAGCLVPCRLLGVLEAEQGAGKKIERNDRLIAVAMDCRDHKDLHGLQEVSANLLQEIEHFFTAYHDLDGKLFRTLGRRGPRRAAKLVREAAERFAEANVYGEVEGNGKPRTRTAAQ